MLPVDAVLPDLLDTLEGRNTVLLQAPTGSGKTTRVPPALLGASWCGQGRILLLEPRRLAARAAAGFMAREMDQAPGETVGYRTRLETRVSARTRIEVVTEGILTRIIQNDPALTGYSAVVFDEFHERSLNADLGLALARESQQALREDLRILIMSATLETGDLAALLDDAPLVSGQGRSFPVTVDYRPCPREKRLPAHVAAVIRRALAEESGSLLVFLPGAGEIRTVAGLLADKLPGDTLLCPLYGQLSPAEQDAAIAPAPAGRRKVVLATAIAESSLTIEGIRIVVDGGLQRRARFDPNSGMTGLITERVSKASAEQRRGRASRLEPGRCYRLWSESEQASLRAQTPPEILEADLAPLVLELALWGVNDPSGLTWLDPPPAAHWNQAAELLAALGAIDAGGALTAHGRRMLDAGLHPRLAHMVVAARQRGQGRLAAELAALLSERDPLRSGSGSDMNDRVRLLHAPRPRTTRGRLQQIRRLADRIEPGPVASGEPDRDATGRLLALAFPDRIARARKGARGRFLLSNGRGAFLPEDDPLAGEAWLAVAGLDGRARDARIFLAAALDLAAIETELADRIEEVETADWDDRRGKVVVRRQRRLGRIVLAETEAGPPDRATIEAGLLAAVRRKGIDALPWNENARQWQARVRLLHELWPEDWPDVDDDRLLERLDDWLAPFLAGMNRFSDLGKLDLIDALETLLDPSARQQLARLAPGRIEIPTGRRVRLDYSAENGPVLATKLQSVFGWRESPRIAGDRVAVVLHLLSPAGRPLAVTADLASFWQNAYPEVRRDMRGRYPKHPWPEEPWKATPTEGVKKRS
ncbi:MAG: ATP-dependent helicase HrpB [Wenzhouxiangella sp.]